MQVKSSSWSAEDLTKIQVHMTTFGILWLLAPFVMEAFGFIECDFQFGECASFKGLLVDASYSRAWLKTFGKVLATGNLDDFYARIKLDFK
jgi:hypothetical protein